jgi:type IV fimbrial biogenesis protein FimT
LTNTQNRVVNTSTQPFFCYAPSRQHGFTLVELMVAVSIAAILLAVGIPSFRSTIASNRLTSTTNDLVGTLSQARSEAIRRGARVTVCVSSDGETCATTGTWEQGWISFVDVTRSGTTAEVNNPDPLNPVELLLAVTQRGATSTLIKGSTDAAMGGPDVAQYVSFSSDGTARKMLGTAGGGILRICEPSSALINANRAREIDVSAVGRMSTTTPTSVTATCPPPAP